MISLKPIFLFFYFLAIIFSFSGNFLSTSLYKFFSYTDDIFIILLILSTALLVIVRSEFTIPYFKELLLLVFFVTLSSAINYNYLSFVSFLLTIKSYFLTLLLIPVLFYFIDQTKIKLMIYSYLFVISILAILGILEFFFQSHIFDKLNKYDYIAHTINFRSYSLVGNPNDYAYFLTFGFFFSFATITSSDCIDKTKVYFFILLLILLFGILVTMSVGASFAILFTLFFYSIRLKYYKKYFFQVIFFTILLIVFLNSRVILRFENLFNLDSQVSRFLFYLNSFPIIIDNPFFGVGAGNYGGVFSDKLNFIYSEYGIDMHQMTSIDCFYPHIIAELGFFVFFAYMYLFFKVYNLNKYIYKYSINHSDKILSISTNMYIFSFVISGFYTLNFETNMHMLILIGLSVITYKNYYKVRNVQR